MVAIKSPDWALLKGPHVRGGSTPYCSTVQYSTVVQAVSRHAAWPPDLASHSGNT